MTRTERSNKPLTSIKQNRKLSYSYLLPLFFFFSGSLNLTPLFASSSCFHFPFPHPSFLCCHTFSFIFLHAETSYRNTCFKGNNSRVKGNHNNTCLVWWVGFKFWFCSPFPSFIGKVERKEEVGLIGGKVMAFWFCCGKVSTRYGNNSWIFC